MCTLVSKPLSFFYVCRDGDDGMSKNTAWVVQCAVLVGLIGGLRVPCLRLSTLKTCRHQGVFGKCFDRDCPVRNTCLGNRIVCEGEGDNLSVKYIAPHHKNEGRGNGKPITVTLPKGDFADLVALHIKEGHRVLTMACEEPVPNTFVTKTAKAFGDVSLCQFWSTMTQKVGT